jgi:hypothetical protein
MIKPALATGSRRPATGLSRDYKSDAGANQTAKDHSSGPDRWPN